MERPLASVEALVSEAEGHLAALQAIEERFARAHGTGPVGLEIDRVRLKLYALAARSSPCAASRRLIGLLNDDDVLVEHYGCSPVSGCLTPLRALIYQVRSKATEAAIEEVERAFSSSLIPFFTDSRCSQEHSRRAVKAFVRFVKACLPYLRKSGRYHKSVRKQLAELHEARSRGTPL